MGGTGRGAGHRLSDGTIVVVDQDEDGQVIRETYYTPDRAWVRAVVEYGKAPEPEDSERVVEALTSSGSSAALRRRLGRF